MSISKFQDLAAFVNVVQQGSFAGAAKQIGVSASAVTKGIARLEAELGVQLFSRSTRKSSLTGYGQEFYERCVRILADLEEAESMMRDLSAAPAGLVRVVMPFSFGRVTVIPELPRFFERYPDIKLDIKFSDAPIDLIKEGYDLAVSSGDLADSRLVRRVLLRGPMTVVASPSYLAQHGTPKVPEDLVGHRCIIGKFGPNWTFQRDSDILNVRVDGDLYLQSGDAYREAAVYGLGIGYSTRWLFRRDIASGALVSLLDDYTRDDIPISVLYNNRRHVPKKVLAMMNFLAEITRPEDSGENEDLSTSEAQGEFSAY